MDTYDVVIGGSGTRGQTAAFDLNEKGLKGAVFEWSDRPGGTFVLTGCYPKKWFYEATETVTRSRHLKRCQLTRIHERNPEKCSVRIDSS